MTCFRRREARTRTATSPTRRSTCRGPTLVLYDNPLKIMPAWLMFTEFMRFVDAPQPAPLTASAKRGQDLFSDIGCALCHTPSFKTRGTVESANAVAGNRTACGGAARQDGQSVLRPGAASHGCDAGRQRDAGGKPARTSSEPLRCGDSANACSSCTTDVPAICWWPYRTTFRPRIPMAATIPSRTPRRGATVRPRPIGWSAFSTT